MINIIYQKIPKLALVISLVMILSLSGEKLNAQYSSGGTQIDYGVHPPDHTNVGRAGWQFLKIPTDARYAALAGIAGPIATGQNAIAALEAPASIPDIENWNLSFSSMNWLADIQYMSGAIVKNFGNLGTFGVTFISLDYGDMEITENAEILTDDGARTGLVEPRVGLGTFTGGDLSLGLTYARQVTDRLQVGGSLRYVQTSLADASTNDIMLDVGTMYYTGIKTWRISMVGQNFGPDVEFAEYTERIGIAAVDMPTPMTFKLGTAIDILEDNADPHLLTIAAEFKHPNDGPEKLHFGTEYVWNNMISLRGGYRYNYSEVGITAGAGLSFETSAGFGAEIDYALMDFGRFNLIHMFTVRFKL